MTSKEDMMGALKQLGLARVVGLVGGKPAWRLSLPVTAAAHWADDYGQLTAHAALRGVVDSSARCGAELSDDHLFLRTWFLSKDFCFACLTELHGNREALALQKELM